MTSPRRVVERGAGSADGEAPRLRALYAAIGGGIGTLLPFLVLYLTSRGLTPTEAGLVVGLMSAVGVVVMPVWGRLADGALGIVPAIRLSFVVAAIASLALLAAGDSGPAIVISAVLLAAGRAPGEALADTLTVNTLSGSAHYGQFRLWASAGFAVMVGTWGFALGYTGLAMILVAYPAALVVAIVSTRGLASPSPRRRVVAQPTGPPQRVGPRLVVLLAGVLVFGIAMGTAFTVLPLRIVDLGGTVGVVGAAMVVGALAEIPLLQGSSQLARRFGPRPMVLLGGAMFSASLILYGTVAAPLALVAISAVRGAGYALVYVGFVTSVGSLLSPERQARGQAWLQTALLGVAPIAGASLGGFGYSHLDPALLFTAAGTVALAGVVIACAGVTSAATSQLSTRT